MLKEWIVHKECAEGIELARELGISPIIGQILRHRGIGSADAARAFLHPENEAFRDPFLMKDMEKDCRLWRLRCGRDDIDCAFDEKYSHAWR